MGSNYCLEKIENSSDKITMSFEIKPDDFVNYYVNTKQNDLILKEQKKFSRIEKKQSEILNNNIKEIEKLKLKIVGLEADNKHYKYEKKRSLIINLISVVCIGIGSSIIGNSLSSIFGWFIIILGVIIYWTSMFDDK